ncbi:MAG: ABC transporter ATP-binding protein [Planctomycetota bacterium]
MDAVIETSALTKDYGSFRALDRLELVVPRGAVYGLLGRNGAGKTTAIRLLMGLLRPTDGGATVLGGVPGDGDEGRMDRIGYVSESMDIPGWMTVGEAARFCRGLSRRWDVAYEERLYAALAIRPDAVVAQLSAGQRRKAGLLLALAPRPELLILDEPASSLDTVVRREFLEQAVELLTDEGTTIFYSSHILSDVERIADHVGILSLGRLVLDSRLDDLLESARRVRVRFDAAVPAGFELPGAVRTQALGAELLVTVLGFEDATIGSLPAGAQAEAMPIGLEDLFIDLVREEGA